MLYYVYIISYTFFFFFSRTSQGVSRFHCYILCKIVFWRYLSPSSSHLFFFLSLYAHVHMCIYFFSPFLFFFQINVTCDSCIKCTFVLSIPMFYTCICTSFIHSCFIHIHVHIYMYVYIYMRICICIDVYVCVCVYVYVLIRVCARA